MEISRRMSHPAAQLEFFLSGPNRSLVPTPAALTPPQELALADLAPLTPARTAATVANALSIVRSLCRFHEIPFRVGLTILDHESPGEADSLVRGFRHSDGVMQTISGARAQTIPRIPRPLALTLLGRPLDSSTPAQDLSRELAGQFRSRLAVQISTGIQELQNALRLCSGYVALSFVAYNAGLGSAAHIATRGRATRRPTGTTEVAWENMCNFGATLLHQRPSEVNVEPGVWRCDRNIPTWYREIRVRDRNSGLLLIAYQYLRSIRRCARRQQPTEPCNAESHGQRRPGSGEIRCDVSRAGALDKLYNPRLLRPAIFQAVQGELGSVTDDGLPIRVTTGGLVKMSPSFAPK